MLSVVLQPDFREVASSLSTHELMTTEMLGCDDYERSILDDRGR